MTLAPLIAALEAIAPPRLAEDWDNVGLLIGSAEDALRGPVLLTIDLTEAVMDEAERGGCGAIIAYHPPIFHPIKRVVGGTAAGAGERVVYRAARAGIAVYSPHTALDACPGGVTDWLAEGLLAAPASGGGGDSRALRPSARLSPGDEVKIVTFVPHEHVDDIRAALASAGAGLIGEYELCSFSAHGTGTFRGKPGTRPAVGKPGQLEQTTEHRLEMVCQRRALSLALATLRQLHPYEQPAVDVYPLEPRPDRHIGAGRRIALDHPCTLDELAARLKRHIGAGAVQLARATAGPVDRIGVVPGSGASLAAAAAADGCQVFVTGEMKHHEVRAALSQGLSVLLGGHTATERGYLARLALRLREALPRVEFTVSRADTDPLEWC